MLGPLLLCSSMVFAAEKKPQEVLDLHYGEVLFHFYQDDFFTATTNLMVAQQQRLLPNHQQESELLLGGLLLSYGLRHEAKAQFERVLDTSSSPGIRNRVWYYLGKIAYQRGLYAEADDALSQMEKIENDPLNAERALLQANLYMHQGKDREAAELLEKIKAPASLQEYLQINQAIALLRAGELNKGQILLDRIGRVEGESEELRALRDRANLGLGYRLLQEGKSEQARNHLNRVRLSGPFAEAALLGAGWADSEQQRYEAALTPWLELAGRSPFDAPVLEAQLAVPFAFEKIGEQARAVHFYQQAIEYYDGEQQRLQEAAAAVRSGLMIELLSQAGDAPSGGWLQSLPVLEGVPATEYLVELLAGNPFQENLKNYRDVVFLQHLVRDRLENMAIYDDMVAARRLAYKQNTPMIRQRLEQGEAEVHAQEWNSLSARIKWQTRNKDPLGLAHTKELEQWRQLDAITETLKAYPNEEAMGKVAQRADWLRGILYWQIQDDYADRLWRVNKAVRDQEADVRKAQQASQRVHDLLGAQVSSFAGFDTRIDTLNGRLVDLQSGLQEALEKSGKVLEHLALQQLEQQRQRLESYRNQARYALARNYDRLSVPQEVQP